ncbi:acetyl-CoA synthetase [Sanguibacter gelidistatuariae]|uniref:Acetyl-CoA synthetase n=1 Tax=Sanguibacter gelidistatuariae TaxID=1814289 RepID=A0A1G6HIS5_9MICO|nr:AMP-binding protein [Sanguibacter gelidistatuariae]SDB93346.1 acetyl-CoA synthetase [Sanguibacter gelidistatuariae]
MLVGLHTDYLTEDLADDGHPLSFSLDCPPGFNFAYDVVDRLGTETPDRRALRWCNDDGERHDYTFGDIQRLSDQAASYFLSQGIRKGDRVLLILKRHAQFWWAITALHKIGAVAVPATNQLLRYDLVFRLNEANVTAVVSTLEGDVAAEVDAAQEETGRTLVKIGVRGARDGWEDLDAGMAAAAPFVRPTDEDLPTVDDAMLLYFTSGTTAQPKMVVHDYSYPIAHIATAKYWHKVDPEGLHLTLSETGWAKSVWGKLYGQWFMETCVDVYDFDRFDATRLLEHLQDAKVTSFCAAPTVYRFLITQDLSSYDLSALQHCTIAGEAMNPVVYETFREKTGLELKEGYGQTEMTLAVVTNYWEPTKAGSMGTPSPGYDVVLLTEDGTEAGIDEDGEICIRISGAKPIGLFTGYDGDPATTAAVWHDGIYHTHDLARRDADGYFWYVGRNDDMIKTSGYRVGPFEVESVVMAHPAVMECAITGAPDEVRGTVIKATIVLAAGYEPSAELVKDIQDFVKHRTAPYKYPRQIEFVDAMPTTISGKIRRVVIRERSKGDAGER